MVAWLQQQALVVNTRQNMTLADLVAYTAAGVPVIVLMQVWCA
jgi:hypothetical protein